MTKLEYEYQKALRLIGEITPKFSKEDDAYFFCSDEQFPTVMYMATTQEKTIDGYKRVLKAFIADYLAGKVADKAIHLTPAWGGKRPGSGRRKKEPTRAIRVPIDIADWFHAAGPDDVQKIRKILNRLKLSGQKVPATKPDDYQKTMTEKLNQLKTSKHQPKPVAKPERSDRKRKVSEKQ